MRQPDSASHSLIFIGFVESELTDPLSAPKQGSEGAPDAWLVFEAFVRDGLMDLREGEEVVVVTWLDRADRSTLRVHPRDDMAQPLTGVFSTRSADRPNPIGLHHVRIMSIIDGLRFHVRSLEAIEGTPILDIKPLIKQ